MNIMMLLEMAASGFGDRTAVGSRDDGITYAEMFATAGRAATAVARSEAAHVALIDTSSEVLPIALFASGWSGRPFVPINYRLTDDELRALGQRVDPALTVCSPEILDRLGQPESGRRTTRADFRSEIEALDEAEPAWDMAGEDVAVLLFTSGTTGQPKAAMLRHRHLVSYILGSVEFMGAGEDEATLVSVPPYHVAGLAAILSSVYAGRRIVQLPNFDAATWIATVEREQVTHAMVVPTMLARIVAELADSGAELSSLRAVSYGGGKMPTPVIDEALMLLPDVRFVNAYGLTETSSTIAVLGPDEHREAHRSTDPTVRGRLGSAGRPLPTIEVEIRDDEGDPVAVGEPGEIWVRGEQVSGEYLEHGSRLTADGWFPTRDAGSLDDEGYLYVEGRIDDIIIRGGENISPGEIEDVLLQHPAVTDAAVVGIADEQWGERVGAAVVADQTTPVTVEELQAFVRGQMRSSRTPDHIIFLDELPYNETGKLLRRVLREQLASAD